MQFVLRSCIRPTTAASSLHEKPTLVLEIEGKKPLTALNILHKELGGSPTKQARWRDEARVAAVMGSCPRSKDSHASGVKHWIRYIGIVYGQREQERHAFPPKLHDVLGWSNTFQCVGTFGNYLSYLRGACHAIGCEAPPVSEPAIRKAMIAIAKRQLFRSREKMFIDKTLVMAMLASVRQGLEDERGSALWLTSYIFLLRLPSEALPACKGLPNDPAFAHKQTLIWREDGDICLRLLRRKNRAHGSGVLRRSCTCKGSTSMCAVHGLWDKFWANKPDGEQPWAFLGATAARRRLRELLQRLNVPNAQKYGTQDFRRGHAEDMRKHGCTLAEILRAGQWKSAAFMTYLDEACMDKAKHVMRHQFCEHICMPFHRIWPSRLLCKATMRTAILINAASVLGQCSPVCKLHN